ncbi:alpha/beta hydrolase [Acidothermaceae bacterium B102]|nr:alpha/beta hydrolase [Acidothermaceae bacterium B102]
MTQQQRDLVHTILRNAPFDLGGVAAVQRPLLDQLLTAHPLPGDVHVTRAELGGVPVALATLGGSAGVLFHLHGGGFAVGSAQGSLGLATSLARRTGLSVVAVDYRLAPEHPFPAAADDALAAYEALVEREGGADRIVVCGESAGGNLAVGLLVAARQAGLPLPSSALLLSPMTDLTVSGASFAGKAAVDPNITAQAIRTRVADYLDGTGTSPADPRVSPIFADLTSLPPLLVQVGSHEVLLDDATQLAVRAAAADVDVTLDVTSGVPHVFQAFAGVLDEGAAALDRAGAFVRAHLSTAQKVAAS